MKNVHEIFNEFEQRTTRHDKLAVLRFNASYALKQVLMGAFHPNVHFHFRELPEYTKSDSPIGLGYSTIAQEINRAYLFEIGHPKAPPGLTHERRKQLLIQILEALEAKEAEIYGNMILKNLNVDGLTYDLVKEAFPDILP